MISLQAQYQKIRVNNTQKLFLKSQEKLGQKAAFGSNEAISQEEYDIVLNQYNTTLQTWKLVEAQIKKTNCKSTFNGTLGLRQVSEGSVIEHRRC